MIYSKSIDKLLDMYLQSLALDCNLFNHIKNRFFLTSPSLDKIMEFAEASYTKDPLIALKDVTPEEIKEVLDNLLAMNILNMGYSYSHDRNEDRCLEYTIRTIISLNIKIPHYIENNFKEYIPLFVGSRYCRNEFYHLGNFEYYSHEKLRKDISAHPKNYLKYLIIINKDLYKKYYGKVDLTSSGFCDIIKEDEVFRKLVTEDLKNQDYLRSIYPIAEVWKNKIGEI